MSERRLHFLLLGNGPYTNRGCEAIVRGTMAILRREFGDQVQATVGSYATPEELARQAAHETDPGLRHVCLTFQRHRGLRRRLHAWFPALRYGMLRESLAGACAALEVGGDNYSLDYGRPSSFMALGRYLALARRMPVVLWGASVGPFEPDPEFAPQVLDYLRSRAGLLVRETASQDYLKQCGITANVHLTADPAFALDPQAPPPGKVGCDLPEGALGLNLSPLMARYVTGGDPEAWRERSTQIVLTLAERTGRPIVLIPHVDRPDDSDGHLLGQVAARVAGRCSAPVHCLGSDLTAAETKWVISRMAAFAGARTHATIAAFSSGVPTLSFAYSTKALGINRDLLGTLDYCLRPEQLTPEQVADRMCLLLDRAEQVRALLAQRLPAMRERAFAAAPVLRQIIGGG